MLQGFILDNLYIYIFITLLFTFIEMIINIHDDGDDVTDEV